MARKWQRFLRKHWIILWKMFFHGFFLSFAHSFSIFISLSLLWWKIASAGVVRHKIETVDEPHAIEPLVELHRPSDITDRLLNCWWKDFTKFRWLNWIFKCLIMRRFAIHSNVERLAKCRNSPKHAIPHSSKLEAKVCRKFLEHLNEWDLWTNFHRCSRHCNEQASKN